MNHVVKPSIIDNFSTCVIVAIIVNISTIVILVIINDIISTIVIIMDISTIVVNIGIISTIVITAILKIVMVVVMVIPTIISFCTTIITLWSFPLRLVASQCISLVSSLPSDWYYQTLGSCCYSSRNSLLWGFDITNHVISLLFFRTFTLLALSAPPPPFCVCLVLMNLIKKKSLFALSIYRMTLFNV